MSIRALFWLLAFAFALIVACSGSDDAEGDGAPDVAPEVSDDAVQPPPNACADDADCRPSSQCQVATCVGGACQEQPRPDGTDCADDPCLVATCSAGVCSQPAPVPAACGERECGRDACGYPCGECTFDEACSAQGRCESLGPCGGVTYDGCCTADNVAKWCDGDVLETTDCKGPGPFHYCGWSDLGYYCSDAPSESSDLPRLCPGEVCNDTCEGKVCGWVCGKHCGTCPVGQFCAFDNTCTACKQGECGGGCGTCPEGEFCYGGACVADMCALGDDGTGCCTELGTAWCDPDAGTQFDSCPGGCGWDAANGWYDCGFEGADPSHTYPWACSFATDPGPEVVDAAEAVEPVPPVEPDDPVEPMADAGPADTADAGAAEASADAAP